MDGVAGHPHGVAVEHRTEGSVQFVDSLERKWTLTNNIFSCTVPNRRTGTEQTLLLPVMIPLLFRMLGPEQNKAQYVLQNGFVEKTVRLRRTSLGGIFEMGVGREVYLGNAILLVQALQSFYHKLWMAYAATEFSVG